MAGRPHVGLKRSSRWQSNLETQLDAYDSGLVLTALARRSSWRLALDVFLAASVDGFCASALLNAAERARQWRLGPGISWHFL